MRVLVVEDEVEIARQVADALGRSGYVVDMAHDGDQGHFLGDTETYDVVILDLGLPGMNGLSVLESWRSSGHKMPVMILSARGSWQEKVSGLRAGADDYLAKPFEMEELAARIEALIRRRSGNAAATIKCGDATLDTAGLSISKNGSLVILTAMEYRLAAYMMMNADRVLSKTELMDHIYGLNEDKDSNTIEVLINRLRNKFGADFILTQRGHGYRIKPEDTDQK